MHNKLQMHNHSLITNNNKQSKQLNNVGAGGGAGGGSGGGGGGGSSAGGDGLFDVLPKQFVASMKTLFDILDDRGTGYVKLADIETGWQDDGSKGLPHGVIDSLRKVTPANGMLSFDRFCAGLKICLLRNQTAQAPGQQINNTATAMKLCKNEKIRRLSSDNLKLEQEFRQQQSKQPIRPPSAPVLDINNPTIVTNWNNTATVRPNNAMQNSQRALSLPQLSPDSDLDQISNPDSILLMNHSDLIYPTTSPPPKPPRSATILNASQSQLHANHHLTTLTNNINSAGGGGGGGIDKAEIRHALQNWQMGILMNEMDAKDQTQIIYPMHNSQHPHSIIRGTADGGTTIEYISTTGSNNSNNNNSNNSSINNMRTSPNSLFQKKPNIKRREPRRHTLQNGIDYNLLKRLKQFEGERDVLLEGLSAVEKARDWYLQQLSNVQEKMKYLGRMGSHVIQWSEVHQERLDFQRARVLEINRHLSTLSEIPLHMNLAVRHNQSSRAHVQSPVLAPAPPLPPLPLDRFKAQQQQQSLMHHSHRPPIHQQSLIHHQHLLNDINHTNIDRLPLFETDNQILKRNRGAQIGLPSNLVHSDMTF